MTDAKWWQKLTLPLARWAKKLTALKLEETFDPLQVKNSTNYIIKGIFFRNALKKNPYKKQMNNK
jgi:hypothetical protein